MHRPHFRTHPQIGATLIELLVVVAIFGALALQSASAVSSWGDSMKLSGFTNALVSQLHQARSEAVKRSSRVAICKSATGVACASAGSWDQGGIMFHDLNNNGQREASEAILRHMQALPTGWRVVGNQSVNRYVSFEATGETKLVSGGFQAGTLTVCRQSAGRTAARKIVINAVGRARVEITTVASCP